MKYVPVTAIMHEPVFYADVEEYVTQIVELMKTEGIGSIIVLDKGIPKGIITERDIVKSCIMGKSNFISLKAKDIRSYPIVGITEEQSIIAAAKLMKEKCIKKLVVWNGKREVIGIITQTDITYNIDLIFQTS
ncbi:TPA: CBS domain-containing protein [Candidatus Woesearchaeota archaeon]|nr:CBS domain-containing protein [Candidatus Woesearchaeota archaeon]HII69017.1 CBS domain-containing protein [Candidatus Woesearchaeota archaeon]